MVDRFRGFVRCAKHRHQQTLVITTATATSSQVLGCRTWEVHAREVIVRATHRGCAFHWGQAVWRKIADVGLQSAYSSDEGTYRFCRQLLALPYSASVASLNAFVVTLRQASYSS